jgi:hypothetical protein
MNVHHFLRLLSLQFQGLVENLVASLRALINNLLHLLRAWFSWLLRLLRGRWREERYEHVDCLEIPPDINRRPDPCLYSQTFLAAQGIAVTWNNPDIRLTTLAGIPAPTHEIEADTEYFVIGTIHNASFDAAIGVSVRCAVRPWGIDFSQRTPVEVDAAGNPAQRILHIGPWGEALATFRWRTPNVERGHYCLTVECAHPADREPNNNVGQENTDVRRSSVATPQLFTVPFFNRRERFREFFIRADEYQIPDKRVELELEQITGVRNTDVGRRNELLATYGRFEAEWTGREEEILKRVVERDALRGARIRLAPKGRRGRGYRVFGYRGRTALIADNRINGFPLTEGWAVTIPGLTEHPAGWHAVIPPGTTQDIQVIVDVPADATPGTTKAINLTATDQLGGVVGGVTIYVEVEA